MENRMTTSNIRKRRRELELSQYQLEFLTGINQSKLSLAERGFRNLDDGEKRKLAKVLHMEITEIFDSEE